MVLVDKRFTAGHLFPTTQHASGGFAEYCDVPWDPTTPKARFLFAIGILKDGPCCWLRASRSPPTKLQDGPRLGLRLAPRRSWYFGTRRFATCPVPLPRSTLGGFLFRAPRCLP